MFQPTSAPEPTLSDEGAPPAPVSLRGYVSALRIYPPRAWMAIIACSIATMLGPTAYSTLTIFALDPMSQSLGWSRTSVLTIFSLPLFVIPFVLIIGGRLVDRFGVRRVAFPAVVLYALTVSLVAFVPANKIELTLLLAVSSACGCAASVAVSPKAVAVWFPHHRGAGFAVLATASALCSAIAPTLIQLSIGSLGWRGTFVALGACILVFAVPVHFFLLSDPAVPAQGPAPGPARHAEPAAPPAPAAPQALPGASVKEAMLSRAFLVVVLVFVVMGGVSLSVRQNAVSMFGEHGYSSALISYALSIAVIGTIAGQFVAGLLADRLKSPWVIMFSLCACNVLGLLLAMVSHGEVWLLFLVWIVLSVAYGAEFSVLPFLIGRYHGMRNFGQIQGLSAGAVQLFGTIAAPILVSAAEERSGSYNGVIMLMIIASAIAALVVFFLPRYPALDVNPRRAALPGSTP